MELIVLGSSAAMPSPGDACSGYLIRHETTEVLLDCGPGVCSRLLEHTTLGNLAAVVISHFHPDHYLDLVPVRYGLHYGGGEPRTIQVWVPPDGIAFLRQLGMALRGNSAFFSERFSLHEYDAHQRYQIGELTMTLQRTTHDVPTWAVALVGEHARFIYSADTRPCAELEEFARGADLFLCESTYPRDTSGTEAANHLRGFEAGELARRAGVARLVLTHFWTGFDRDVIQAEDAAAFGAPVERAAPGARFVIAPRPAPADR